MWRRTIWGLLLAVWHFDQHYIFAETTLILTPISTFIPLTANNSQHDEIAFVSKPKIFCSQKLVDKIGDTTAALLYQNH